MFSKSQLIWAFLFSSLVAVSLAQNRNESRKRQLRQFLLESKEDQSSKSEEIVSSAHKSSKLKFDPRWFTAQPKIARIHTADGRRLNISEKLDRDYLLGQKKVDHFLEEFSKRKLEIERNKDGLTVSTLHFRPKKFHCQPIQDMHVPKLNRTLPAYMCKLGPRHFVLTSERFLYDRRSHVDVNIDDGTYLKLSSGAKATSHSAAEIIPATLVYNKEHNVYGIKRT